MKAGQSTASVRRSGEAKPGGATARKAAAEIRSVAAECLVSAFRSSFDERILLERQGVPAAQVQELVDTLGIAAGEFHQVLGMPKSTFHKKLSDRSPFSGAPGQAVLGIADLIGMVAEMVDPESSSEAAEFDPARWVGEWIQRPQPALAGRRPAELMDTPTGRAAVRRLLAAVESGAYQ